MGKENLITLLPGFVHPSKIFLNGAIFNTFCRRKKYSKTPLQIYKAIFATQNRSKNSPITHKAHYPSLFLELLLNRFASSKNRVQKHIAIGCKRTKGIGISVAQRWRRSFISGAYAVSNCLVFLKRSFGTPFCSFQKVSKDAMNLYYTIGYGDQNRTNPKMAQKQYTDLITYTIRHSTKEEIVCIKR